MLLTGTLRPCSKAAWSVRCKPCALLLIVCLLLGPFFVVGERGAERVPRAGHGACGLAPTPSSPPSLPPPSTGCSCLTWPPGPCPWASPWHGYRACWCRCVQGCRRVCKYVLAHVVCFVGHLVAAGCGGYDAPVRIFGARSWGRVSPTLTLSTLFSRKLWSHCINVSQEHRLFSCIPCCSSSLAALCFYTLPHFVSRARPFRVTPLPLLPGPLLLFGLAAQRRCVCPNRHLLRLLRRPVRAADRGAPARGLRGRLRLQRGAAPGQLLGTPGGLPTVRGPGAGSPQLR